MYNVLLKDRNDDWINQIEEMVTSPPIEFILVGNMHLFGADGLLERLQKKGYKIRQLNN